jgi:glycerophosphoryl diester phosphodiesterase
MKILKIAHRGAKGCQPENTIIAFQTAINMGADAIELDVHLSLDNQLIVIHDHTIDRTKNGNGFINQMTLSQIKSVLINSIYEIPTLDEVFVLVNRSVIINIEIKEYKAVESVVNLIEKYVFEKKWHYTDFLVSSFDWHALQQVVFLNENIPIGVLTKNDIDTAFAFAKFINAKAIHPHFKLLNHQNVAKIQSKNILVFPWTVNNPEDIFYIKSLNVNGIITDFVDRL